MRIGINTLYLVPGDVGGTEVYLRQNLKYMARDHREHTFVLFTSRDNDSIFRSDLSGYSNISFCRHPFRSAIRPLRIILEQTLLPWYVRKKGVDVLWSPGYTAPVWSSCPQAVTIHDLQYKSHPDDMGFTERMVLDVLVRSACRNCEAVITVSRFSKEELKRFHFARPEKIYVAHGGVDSRFGGGAHLKSLHESGLPGHTPYILCVAHTYPHKKVDVLVEAFDLIAAEIPHHLVLLGKPRRGEMALKRSLSKSGHNDRIHRFHRLPFENLLSVYQGADLFVLPSDYEGFGLPILEAMMAGLPVVTTRKASLPEVGGNQVAYVESNTPKGFARKMLEIIEMDAEDKKARIAGAIAWAASFTWSKSAGRTLDILEKLADNQSQG